MSEATPVARIQLRDSYDIDGKPTGRAIYADEYVMAYEEDTDKMVVNRRGSGTVHVIPWANIVGFQIQREAPKKLQEETKVPEADGAGPARPTGGGTRRARTAQ